MRIILAVGGILAVSAYVGPKAMWSRQRWSNFRTDAAVEEGNAKVQAALAPDATNHAAQLRLEGRMSEAERLAREVEGYRQGESLQ